MQLVEKIGYETEETKGFGWLDAVVEHINNINKSLRLPLMGWNQIEFKKDFLSHLYTEDLEDGEVSKLQIEN